jgi:hypothetical protein
MPKSTCPWRSCTIPTTTKMAARTQRTVAFTAPVCPDHENGNHLVSSTRLGIG